MPTKMLNTIGDRQTDRQLTMLNGYTLREIQNYNFTKTKES